VDPRRWLLTAVLALIAAMLLLGGARLAMLGGSLYYVIAGIAVAGCAYFVARGDARGRCLYAALLIGTIIWAFCERGLDPWGLQARLFAPAALAIWVFWPVLRRWPLAVAAGGVLVAGVFVWLLAGGAEPVMKPVASAGTFESSAGDWLHFGNDLGGTRFAALGQITPDNVGQLKEAWRSPLGLRPGGSSMEATPLFIKDTLYLCTPENVIVALDSESGQRRWTFDPKTDAAAQATCRGVAYYAVPNATGLCAERIIFATVDARLMAVDAHDGNLCSGFGQDGTVDLKEGLGTVPRGYWHTSSAPDIVRGNVVIGARVTDNQYVGEPSGVIRGFDAVTGRLAWAWDMDHPDRHGAPPAGETYSPSTPNSWGPISGDEALGLVFLPMGNATPDYWGAYRSPASEKYSSGVVALDATTGEVRWFFQTTHHDLWDYDVASQPTLTDLAIDGQTVPVLIQGTKRGQIFVLDRRTGTPVTKIEEKPVPQGPAPGDFLSPTQPFSTGMPVFDRTVWTERTMWGTTPLDQLWCRIKFREARYEGPLTPPGIKPTITYPGYLGGMNWSGVAVDPERNLMVVNWTRVANYTQLVPRATADAMGVTISTDGNIHFNGPDPQKGTPFAIATNFFWSPLVIPCTSPPFGKIAVVDLATQQIRWQRTLGTAADLGPFLLPLHLPLPTGTANVGGSVVTRSGLVFIAAAMEHAIRAFDIRDGRKLWTTRLPAGAQATPITYIDPRNGKQYVVVVAGGDPHAARASYVVAYALP
jgi:membrane-bound PQQ-dependent dehydrogenase (glucose/quinate/shikimate family)